MATLAALEGNIETRGLEEEMRSSYLDYAMSVIVGRALPDVRDGLKPVHRRVLYAMLEGGLLPNRPYRKCARVVGDVMGNYHPHGDAAIYDTLVRLAQDFASREPLVDGQGNFGSIDDDPPAAMRYTEAKLSKLATELLRDIDAGTVDFGPNYDSSRTEPLVLPARYPNLLVNGSSGIAVGMATNIPPHNLGEAIDATMAFIDDPDISGENLMKHIKGPDFPGGGIILGRDGILDAYKTGRGSIVVRARAHTEPLKSGKEAIVVTELPYMVKKGGDSGLITKIADLVRDKKITEITDLRDETDRTGMRLVIELKRDAVTAVVLNKLYKHTSMQQSFGANFVALVDGVPRTLTLQGFIENYVRHQREVVTRRTKYELRKAEARAHILEGLLTALANLDDVIKLIRGSRDVDSARKGLMKNFDLSQKQSQAILDMRLQRLTALESEKIETEHADLLERIKELRQILGDEKRLNDLIKDELIEIKEIYANDRRTEISAAEGELDIEDLIAEEQMVIAITNSGYIKRLPLATYRQQKRGGIGVTGMDLKEGDYIEHLFISSTHDYLLFFTTRGNVYRLKVHELPLGSRTSKGRALVNLLPLRTGGDVRAVMATRDFSEDKYLVFATKNGIVKKTLFSSYDTQIKVRGIIAINIRGDDELVAVRRTDGDEDIIMVSKAGYATRFHESKVRPTGRATSGVIGMNVKGKGNRVLAMDIAKDESQLLVVTENGFGKRSSVSEYPVKGRATKGVKTVQLTDKKGALAGGLIVKEHEELIFISREGMVQRTAAKGISKHGRATQGVRVMNLKKGDCVSAVAPVVETEDIEPDDIKLEGTEPKLEGIEPEGSPGSF